MGFFRSDALAQPMGADEAPLVEACGLVKTYGKTAAVRGISFGVKRGEVVGFLGPNGAGKSTTMKMLTGFLKPSAGMAKIAGIDVAQDPMAVRRVLGYLPENAPLYDDMMVIDFLNFIAELRHVAKSRRRSRLTEACERCGLTEVLGKDIGQLSKGYRQRVGLAQALLHDPDLLILDEPTSGLDPNQIIEIRELIRDLGRDKTVILSTHILPEVQATCDRILIISAGTLVADDRPEDLSRSSTAAQQGCVIRLICRSRDPSTQRPQVAQLLGTLPGVTAVDAYDSDSKDSMGFVLRAGTQPDVREALFEAAVAHNLIILDMHRETVSLEDAFRRLTRGEPAAKKNHRQGRASSAGEGAHA
jgi:ABC-2 type transport system ATP-binding protein